MIDYDDALSVTRQARTPSISRGSVNYPSPRVAPEDLVLSAKWAFRRCIASPAPVADIPVTRLP